MSDSLRASYEEVSYPASPHPQTHPSRLSAIGTLLGLHPKPMETSRVLEIGCSNGSNIIPWACAYLTAEFVGIDLAPSVIQSGQQIVGSLGLENLKLIEGDFQQAIGDFGLFDTIVAHGVYSWISAEMAERLLFVIANALTEDGIAYVSYNTWPGWQPRASLRAFLTARHGGSHFNTNDLGEVRTTLTSLDEACRETQGPFPTLLSESIQAMLAHADGYIAHDLLEVEQHPVRFLDFVDQLARHGLQYVGDAEFHTMLGRGLPAMARQKLNQLARTPTEWEQLMDLLLHRSFRQLLVCRADRHVTRDVPWQRIASLWVTGLIREIHEGDPWQFVTHRGLSAHENDPLRQEVLRILAENYPSACSFPSLVAETSRRIGRDFDEASLGMFLLQLFSYDAVDLQVADPRIATTKSERFVPSRFACWQSLSASQVTNLRHELVSITETDRQLLMSITSDRAERSWHREDFDADDCWQSLAAKAILQTPAG